MKEQKRYWLVINYETELLAESEEEACVDIRMGNTIVEEATVIAKELNSHDDWKKLINQARIEARRESSLNIILKQLCYKMKDFSLIFHGLPTDLQEKVDRLSLEDLENLSIESLKINSLDQLKELLSTYSI